MRIGLFRNTLLLIAASTAWVGCGSRLDLDPQADPTVVDEIRTGLLAGGSAEETTSAQGGQPTGFATLKGTFRFEGQAPSPVAVSITKDATVCESPLS